MIQLLFQQFRKLRRYAAMINKKDIIDDLKNINIKLGKIPTKKDYDAHGKFSSGTVRKKFLSWSTAIRESFSIEAKPKKTKHNCENCGKLTINPRFCSCSCSASLLNRTGHIGRKRRENYCKLCGSKFFGEKRIRCSQCRHKIKTNNGEYKCINTLTKSQISTKDTQRYRRIRTHARYVAKINGLLEECIKCGYNIHVECAHKNSISSYPDTTLISTINDPSNLAGLCRNHHWEFDHNMLFLK